MQFIQLTNRYVVNINDNSSLPGGVPRQHSRFHDASPGGVILSPSQCLVETKTERFGMVYCCLMALTAQTGYIVPREYEIYHEGPGDKTNIQLNNETIH